MAAVVDHLAVANWMFATVNRDEDAEPAPYPEPVPRPGAAENPAVPAPAITADTPEARDRTRGATPAEIVAFLNSPA